MADVFLSYAHEDRAIAERVAMDLREAGVKVWFDQFELVPGDVVSDHVRRGLREAQNFVAIVSKNSIRSNWFNSEIATAIASADADKRRKVIPILADKNAEMPPFLRQRLYIPMFDDNTYQDGLPRLLHALEKKERREDDLEAASKVPEVQDLAQVAREQLALERAYQAHQLKIRAEDYRVRIKLQGFLTLLAALLGVAGAVMTFFLSSSDTPIREGLEFSNFLIFIFGVFGGVIFNSVFRYFSNSLVKKWGDEID